MRDTSAEAASVQIAAFRRLTPAERVAMAFDASEWVMSVARARLTAFPRSPNPAVRSDGDPLPPDRDARVRR